MEYSELQPAEGFETVKLWEGAITITSEMENCNVLSTEARLVGEGIEQNLINFEKNFWLNRTWSELCLRRGALYCRKILGENAFICDQQGRGHLRGNLHRINLI